MLINRDIEYAVLGLLILGKNWRERITIKDIAAKAKVPRTFLSKIFQKLNQAKIVEQKSGPKGGFILTKEPQKISLSDIFQAVNQNIFTDCLNYQNNTCNKKQCSLRKTLKTAEMLLKDYFQKENLQNLLN